jgi:hypothetical protein
MGIASTFAVASASITAMIANPCRSGRSASRPPIQCPADMPASTVAMIAVHV